MNSLTAITWLYRATLLLPALVWLAYFCLGGFVFYAMVGWPAMWLVVAILTAQHVMFGVAMIAAWCRCPGAAFLLCLPAAMLLHSLTWETGLAVLLWAAYGSLMGISLVAFLLLAVAEVLPVGQQRL